MILLFIRGKWHEQKTRRDNRGRFGGRAKDSNKSLLDTPITIESVRNGEVTNRTEITPRQVLDKIMNERIITEVRRNGEVIHRSESRTLNELIQQGREKVRKISNAILDARLTHVRVENGQVVYERERRSLREVFGGESPR